MNKSQEPVVAYSYQRFSHPDQIRGDSLRRQSEGAVKYCARRGWVLSEATYRDLGVSAFRGKNALVGNLGEFLKAVKGGAVKPGSALVVESLDRISRQGIDEGYDLIKTILKSGVLIVTLSPEREFDVSATKSLSKGALEIQLILERAAEESERKSERVAAAWAEKRKRAREGQAQNPTARMGAGCRVLTKKLPAWLECVGGETRVIPERAAAVRRIFELAGAGYGNGNIARQLEHEGVPPFGEDGWYKQYVAKVLKDRRAVGEFQPRKYGKPDGDPVPGYFPQVVTHDEWLVARAGAARRRRPRGRTGAVVNVFAGLVRNARPPHDTYVATTRRSGGKGRPNRVLINTQAVKEKLHARAITFPLETFERGVLALLAEVPVSDVVGGDGPNEVDVLEGEAAQLRGEIENLAEALGGRDVKAVVDRIAALEGQEQELQVRLAEARQTAAVPLASAWQDARNLMTILETAEDQRDVRLRLRGALRRCVTKMNLCVFPRGHDRYALLEVGFQGRGVARFYVLFHHAPTGNQNAAKPGMWWAGSFLIPEGMTLDLSDPGQIAKAEAAVVTFAIDAMKAELNGEALGDVGGGDGYTMRTFFGTVQPPARGSA